MKLDPGNTNASNEEIADIIYDNYQPSEDDYNFTEDCEDAVTSDEAYEY